ncbi:MAG: phosphoenolpyruvate synthase [Bacteroidetes bacterium]|nr:phosphoenolpyruvate synthase [Bacteroidota bacterium]
MKTTEIFDSPFQDLMAKRVRNILLICSKYDRFMLEEDGRIEELLFQDYVALGLRYPPKITHAPSAVEALALMEERPFELVITMLNIGEIDAAALSRTIKTKHPDQPIIVLSPAPAHKSIKRLKKESVDTVDYIFTWQGNPNILLAMVKLVEDSMNTEDDVRTGDVQVIILVEDSVRYYSTYLPMIYTSLIQQARFIMTEGLNDWSQTQRMRGRPKILLARTYEEAIELYEKYKLNTLGIISDVEYKRDGEVDKEAGLKLCSHIRKENSEIPILLQSSIFEHKKYAEALKAKYLYKHSQTLLAELRSYIKTSYGFGNFIFRNPKDLSALSTVANLRDLQYAIAVIPLDSFIYHVENNDFSTWLRARALFALARKIRPIVLEDYNSPEELRSDLIKTIKFYRQQRGRGVIARFNKDRFDEVSFFTRIGSGSLGGKGRGLAFVDLQLKQSGIPKKYPDMYISIPRTIVITTELFDRFMEENDLQKIALSGRHDDTILEHFIQANLPDDLIENLKAALRIIKAPVAVRSSSLLEDSHYQPFAGIYQTCMLPNNHPDFDKRLADLCKAIKCIYASTFFRQSKDYMKATDHIIEEEKMAVIIQQITGSQFENFTYPNFSGVARSLNYYPIEREKPEDGIVYIAFGFGKIVVDAGSSLRFSPKHPKKVMQLSNPNHALKKTQKDFYALDMEAPFAPTAGTADNLTKLSVQDAANHGSLKYIASTYDLRSGRFSDSPNGEGQKVMTFSGILKYKSFPIAQIIQDILKLGEEIMNTPIEIEFAGNLNRPPEKLPEFSLLQIRPIVEGSEFDDINIDENQIEKALVYSKKAMGNGKYDDLVDVVYVKPSAFDPAKTREMAERIGIINSEFEKKDTGYVLIVVGRLGSSDPWLGIPAAWNQISYARVIIETGLANFQVEPSQGTHFFQNLTSLRNSYMTINPVYNDGLFRIEIIDAIEAVYEDDFIRHVCVEKPLQVVVDGKTGNGVILYNGN